ncbi:MAG: hypothetical protein ACREH5_07335 [Candidatus Omnitrophota bacterium]
MSKKGGSTVLWWVGWIVLTIVTFFISCWFWTGFIAERVGDMRQPGVPLLWVTAVFGSWMVLLVPLIIVMYSKVDKAYEDARITRETAQFSKARLECGIKSVLIDEPKRLLNRGLSDKLKKLPEAVRRGHLVTAVLKDGRRVENVFIMNKRDVLGVYGADAAPVLAEDIADLEPADLDKLPAFKTENWLRLDGVGGAPSG